MIICFDKIEVKVMTGIYYSDLFVINNIGCLVMGVGKSKTCRNFTGDNTKEIGVDSIRLEKGDGVLWGYADPTMGFIPFNKYEAQFSKIQFLFRMLNEEETNRFKCSSITEINKEEFYRLCELNITFGVFDENSRINEFKSLIDSVDISCILIPWCTDMKSKGKMISQYIK